MQGQLGKLDARVAGLKEGFDRNGSMFSKSNGSKR